MAHKVFVYGTLRKNCVRGHVLADQEFLGKVETPPKYSLLNLGPFPGLAPGKNVVKGELYEVDDACLGRLDMIEGHPHLFERRTVELNGQEVYTYFFNTDHPEDEATIPSGDWVNR